MTAITQDNLKLYAGVVYTLDKLCNDFGKVKYIRHERDSRIRIYNEVAVIVQQVNTGNDKLDTLIKRLMEENKSIKYYFNWTRCIRLYMKILKSVIREETLNKDDTALLYGTLGKMLLIDQLYMDVMNELEYN